MMYGGVMVGLSQMYACLVARLITGDDYLGSDYWSGYVGSNL